MTVLCDILQYSGYTYLCEIVLFLLCFVTLHLHYLVTVYRKLFKENPGYTLN